MLVVNPSWIYDVGFQLSFAATLGIITLQPFIHSKLSRLPGFIDEVLSTTISAQVFVYPILIASFGQISIISLITNLLIIWVVPLIMFSGIVIVLLAFIAPLLAQLGSSMVFPLLWYVKKCILITSQIPYAFISIKNFSWVAASVYYSVIYCLYKIKQAYEENTSL